MGFRHLLFLSSIIVLLSINCTRLSPDHKLIEHASIIDLETGSILENQSILIENGKISKVFETGYISYDTNNKFDASGLFVIPGLWDMHIHLRGGEALIEENRALLPLYITHGVTTVRDAGGDLTPQVLKWRKEAQNNELVGPYIFTSGPKIDGVNSTWEGSLELTSVEDVSSALDSLVALGADYVKIYDSRLSEELYLEILKQAESRGLKTTGHMPMSVMFEDAIDAGLDGVDHLYYVMKGASSKEEEITEQVRNGELGFWGAVRELLNSYDEEKAALLFQKMAENNVAVVPTLYIDDILSYLHEVDHSDDEMLQFIGEGIQETYARRLNSALRRNDAANAFEAKMNEHFKAMVPPMHEAGIMILPGSDNGAYNSFVYAGHSLHKELEVIVSTGISEIETLRMATQNGPKFFGVMNQYGSIEAMKEADLLFLNENPLEQIKHTQSIEWVMLNGEIFTRTELDQVLQEL